MMEPLFDDWPRKAERALQINTKKKLILWCHTERVWECMSLICRYLLMAGSNVDWIKWFVSTGLTTHWAWFQPNIGEHNTKLSHFKILCVRFQLVLTGTYRPLHELYKTELHSTSQCFGLQTRIYIWLLQQYLDPFSTTLQNISQYCSQPLSSMPCHDFGLNPLYWPSCNACYKIIFLSTTKIKDSPAKKLWNGGPYERKLKQGRPADRFPASLKTV